MPDSTIWPVQRLQNWAARIVLGLSRYASATQALATLHWLPIRQRIAYKANSITFKTLHGMTPHYVSELIHIKQQSYSRTRYDTSGECNLAVPFMKCKTFGDRTYAVSATRLWNI